MKRNDPMTLTAAAEEFGIKRDTLSAGCVGGNLKYTIEALPDRQGAVQRQRLVRRADVREFIENKGTLRHWTEDEDAALIELSRTASSAQIAAYLGRSHCAVNNRVNTLRKAGLIGKRIVNRSPSTVPGTAILIAKTCTRCGKLRGAEYYTKHRPTTYSPSCNICNAEKNRARRSQGEPEPTNEQLLQELTEPHAVNRGQEYTSSDIELLCDKTKSELEIALTIGRTYFGVMGKRSELGVLDPKAPKWKFRRQPDAFWVMNFPDEIAEIQEQFKQLGAVPEELWEWNDIEEMAS